jgi:hypothetical protein
MFGQLWRLGWFRRVCGFQCFDCSVSVAGMSSRGFGKDPGEGLNGLSQLDADQQVTDLNQGHPLTDTPPPPTTHASWAGPGSS